MRGVWAWRLSGEDREMFKLTTLTDYSDEALLSEIRRVVSEFKGTRLTHAGFNQLSLVHSSTLRTRFGSWQKALELAGVDDELAPRKKDITREVLIAEIQEYREQFDVTPTLDQVSKRLKVHSTTIQKRHGSWSDFLRLIGVQSVPLGKRYTDEDCFENIIFLWTYYGRQPTIHELKQAPSRVGSKAYILRWGGWRAALGSFIEQVNKAEGDTIIETAEKPAQTSSAISVQRPTLTSIPRSMSLSLRYKVLQRDRFLCKICGRSPAKDMGVELHIDHIIPWSKGGQNILENLRVLCFDCNLGKGDKIEIGTILNTN
jgi:HNH endonuclease/Homing endonuclease associated repeat